MNINHELLDYFVFHKVIKKKDREKIAAECADNRTSVLKYALDNGFCTQAEALPALGDFYNYAYAEMDAFDVSGKILDRYSPEFLKKIKAVPLFTSPEGVLSIAVGAPQDFTALSACAVFYTGKREYILVPPEQLDVLIDSLNAVRSTKNAITTIKNESDERLLRFLKSGAADGERLDEEVLNAPAVRLVDSFIKEAVPFRASDIHIEPFEKTVKVRYRIDGELQQRAEFPKECYDAIGARLKIMAGLNIAERRIPQDGRINMSVNGKSYDFRVSSLPTVYGEKFVIRVLDKTSFYFTRAELGFTPEENAIVDKMLANPHGIILLTGPAGCGKSTTLYSFLKEKNSPEVNIITVEDPVEYTLDGINQVQVNPKANLTFAAALRSILRQDPDVIMIGEIRDEETADIAIRASITGHLVLSTLHTNDAPGAFTRLVDMGVGAYLVKDALIGVIAQRLVKKLCPICKKRTKTTADEMKILDISEPATIYKKEGCRFCNHTGYKGRIAVHEILYTDAAMKAGFTSHMKADDIRAAAERNGMIDLKRSCGRLVLDGTTDMLELLSICAQ